MDIWLPDLKYYDTALSNRYSQAKNYFDHASEAISQMVRQTGAPVLDSDGNVDKDASRRVEVKFRLKDDEMINELNQIMNTDKTSDSEKSGSN